MFPPPTLFCYFMAAFLIPRAPTYHYESDAEKEFWRQIRLKPSESLSRLRHRYREQEQRIRNMEAFVTSSEAKLPREFRALESSPPRDEAPLWRAAASGAANRLRCRLSAARPGPEDPGQASAGLHLPGSHARRTGP